MLILVGTVRNAMGTMSRASGSVSRPLPRPGDSMRSVRSAAPSLHGSFQPPTLSGTTNGRALPSVPDESRGGQGGGATTPTMARPANGPGFDTMRHGFPPPPPPEQPDESTEEDQMLKAVIVPALENVRPSLSISSCISLLTPAFYQGPQPSCSDCYRQTTRGL